MNLAFEKAGAKLPGQCRKSRKPVGKGLQKLRLSVQAWANENRRRGETIRSAWCCKPVPTSSITASAARFPGWRDLIDAAAILRSALGVSPDAWKQALDVLSEHDAYRRRLDVASQSANLLRGASDWDRARSSPC
ncbi:replication initiation protein RepC [Methylocystis silviterrae]|uniref:replication initiation protein RepC n=1 Tax=Methylocystis silviterrae TaxID=2743612 RepID=UPI003C75D616